jgi:hypothetical protein
VTGMNVSNVPGVAGAEQQPQAGLGLWCRRICAAEPAIGSCGVRQVLLQGL